MQHLSDGPATNGTGPEGSVDRDCFSEVDYEAGLSDGAAVCSYFSKNRSGHLVAPQVTPIGK